MVHTGGTESQQVSGVSVENSSLLLDQLEILGDVLAEANIDLAEGPWRSPFRPPPWA
jgi:hypothetical protein